jgi:hypothetical protein
MCTYECDTDTTYPGCGGGMITHPCE